jgi:hypothetical protein
MTFWEGLSAGIVQTTGILFCDIILLRMHVMVNDSPC